MRLIQTSRKVGLALGGALLGLALVEGGLRLSYQQPPVQLDLRSIDATAQRFSALPTPDGAAFNLAVVGDSVVKGIGAPPGQGVAEVLAARLQATLQSVVQLHSRGRMGADFEMSVLEADALVARRKVDAVAVILFSDDLNAADMVMQKGVIVDLLDQRPSWTMRNLVPRSYLVNLAWLVWSSWSPSTHQQMLGPRQEARLVRLARRLVRRSRQTDVPVLFALLPASGLALCATAVTRQSECNLVLYTLDGLARILQQAGGQYVDLRFIWNNGPARIPANELRDMKSRRLGIAIHPDARGHAMVADAVLPTLVQAIRARKVGAPPRNLPGP